MTANMVFWLWVIVTVVFSLIVSSQASEIRRLRRLIEWNEEDAKRIKKDKSGLWERVHMDHLNNLRWQALVEQYLGIDISKKEGPIWEVKEVRNKAKK